MVTLRATQYVNNGSTFNIIVSPTKQCCETLSRLCNGEQVELITCLSFPAISTLLPVYVQIGTNTYPVLDRLGNDLMTDQIRSRRRYILLFGTEEPHFIVNQCLNASQAAATSVEV